MLPESILNDIQLVFMTFKNVELSKPENTGLMGLATTTKRLWVLFSGSTMEARSFLHPQTEMRVSGEYLH